MARKNKKSRNQQGGPRTGTAPTRATAPSNTGSPTPSAEDPVSSDTTRFAEAITENATEPTQALDGQHDENDSILGNLEERRVNIREVSTGRYDPLCESWGNSSPQRTSSPPATAKEQAE